MSEARIIRGAAMALALAAGPCGPAAQPSAGGGEPIAGDGGAFTLHRAITLALERFPAISAAAAARDQAAAAAGEARASWFPSVRLSGSAVQYEEPMPVTPIHGFSFTAPPLFDQTLLQASGALTYTLFDGGGRPARVRQAGRRADAAAAALTAAEQAIVARVAATYLDVLARREVLAAHDQRLIALDAQQDRVGRLLETGRAAQVEVLRLEAARAAALAERVRMAAALDAAERDLARLAGVGESEARADRLVRVVLADTTCAAREDLAAGALHGSPTFAQIRWLAQAAREGVAAARSARWPEIKCFATYTDYADADGHDSAEWNAGLQLSLAVFTGGSISQGIARAQAAGREASERARLAEIELRGEIDRAAAVVEEVRARLSSLRRAVASYAEVARIEQLALESGAGTQVDYLQAEADLLAARANLAEARYREIAARVDLARIAGSLNLEWLARTLEAES